MSAFQSKMSRAEHLLRQGVKQDLHVKASGREPADKLPLDDEDRRLIQKWKGGSGITAEIALSASRQGWISSRQRAVLRKDGQQRKPRGWGRGGNRHQADYDESDWEIGAYELCVGEWGD